MTAAATKVGEEIAKETLSATGSEGCTRSTDRHLLQPGLGRPADRHVACATARTTSATSSPSDEVAPIVAALDAAGVPVIEVTHGDGLGGSSFNYGFSKTPEQELIKLAAETAKEAKIAFLMLPGVGTKDDITAAQDNGGSICRIATHCTEADVSIQHFGLARELGPGDRRLPDDEPHHAAGDARQAGADHGRRRLPVRLRRRLRRGAGHGGGRATGSRRWSPRLGDDAQVGFHGHENLGLGVANSVMAVRAGATQIDGSVRRFGAGAGNTPVEAFVGVCDKLGWQDRHRLLDDRRRRRGRRTPGDAGGVPARPQCADDGLRRGLLHFLKHAGNARPSATASPAHQLLHRGRSAQAHRRPGGPADRHRAGDQARSRTPRPRSNAWRFTCDYQRECCDACY